MISVLSRQLPLSGSKIGVVFLLLGSLILSSCGGADGAVNRSRKTRNKTVEVTKIRKPKTQTSSKIDTIQWTEAKDGNKPPITDTEGEATALLKEDMYDITYLLPFKANAYNPTQTRSSEKFISYFAGMEMAKEILENEGVKLNINIVDSEKRSIESTLDISTTSETDAIIGLYDTDDLKAAAKYAKRKEIPLVSPWKASTKVTKENPYYVQLRPNLDEYYKSIIKDVVSNYKPEQVFILGRDDTRDQRMVNYVQRIGKAYFKTDELPFQYFEVEADSLIYGDVAFDSIFPPSETNVVIIPHFSNGDEPFIYNCTRRLTVEKGPSKMIVYGMEVMLDSDKISFDQYNALNMKIARTKFVDESDGDVQRFKRRYYEVYGSLPTDDAYEGYDNLMFIGRNIHKYGKNFQHYLDRDQGYYLQAAYDVQKTFPSGSDNDDFKNINYFENKHVDIISFDGRRFHRTLK